MASRKYRTIGYTLILIFVALATAFLLLARDPEMVTIISDDFQVVIEGPIREGARPQILLNSLASQKNHTAVVAPIYDIEPSSIRFDHPLTLTMVYSPDLSSVADQLALGYLDVDRAVWKVVDSIVNKENNYVQASVEHFSPWSILIKREVVIDPAVLAMVDDLIEEGFKDNMVGYRADIAYSTTKGDFVLLFDDYREGGCNEVFQTGNRSQIQSKDMEGLASVDGEELTVDFKILIDWQLGEGCNSSR